MRVSHGNNPYAHQQQRTNGNGKDKGFADMLISMAYNKHGEPEKLVKLDKCSFHTHNVNPRKDHGTQIKPDKEWLNTVGQPNAESKGDKELTGSQIHFLQTHYDVENLTPEARNNLLCDLTDMGVLSAANLSSADQSKVDGVIDQIKAFKMGVGTYVEFPEQPELLISDGSDPELRGLSDDEKFAAIMKKYGGGTTYDSFRQMNSALLSNKLITHEQSVLLRLLVKGDYYEKRNPLEVPGFTMEQGKQFDANYRVSMNDLLKQATKFEQATKFNPYMDVNGPITVDMTFLREFASKFEALSK